MGVLELIQQYLGVIVNAIILIIFLVKMNFSITRIAENLATLTAEFKETKKMVNDHDKEILVLLQKNESINQLSNNAAAQFDKIDKAIRELEKNVDRLNWTLENKK